MSLFLWIYFTFNNLKSRVLSYIYIQIKHWITDAKNITTANIQSSKVHEINEGVPPGVFSLPYPILYKDLHNNINPPLHIYEDDSLTADFSSDRALTAQWFNNWILTFNTLKSGLETFDHHRADPEFLPTMTNGFFLSYRGNFHWAPITLRMK